MTEPRHSGTTRIAAYAICRDDEDRVLLCRLAPTEVLDAGLWTLPGGGVEFGEDPAVTVIRELEEEAGLIGQVRRLRAIDSQVYPPRPGRVGDLHAIRIIYDVAVVGGALRDEVAGSTDRCAWFSPDDAVEVTLVDLADLGLRLAWEATAEVG